MSNKYAGLIVHVGCAVRVSVSIAILISLLAIGLGNKVMAASVPVGSITDTVVVSGSTAEGGGLAYGLSPGGGSVSPKATLGGYSYVKFYSAGLRGKFSTIVSVSGFSSNPGAAWLNSVTCGSVTFSGSTALFSYSGTTATYSWAGAALVSAASESCQINYGGTSGSIYPKYQVVGLTYAPPGSKSTATYASGFMSGTGTSNTSSWTNKVAVSVQVTAGVDLFGILNGDSNNIASASWTQEEDSNSSLSIVQQLTTGLVVPGPPLSSTGLDQGVDHDYDIVYVWLNPAVLLSFSGTAAVLSGYYYDDRDGNTPEKCNGTVYSGITGMDVVPLTVGQLRGTQPITDSCLQARLNRPWDPALGALTSVDFLEIAAADPFYSNPSFNPNSDKSGRFDVPQGQTLFTFVEGTATPQTYNSSYTKTSTAGQSAKSTYSVGYSVSGAASAAFLVALGGKITVSDTYTTTNQWSKTVTAGTSQSNSFTIVPPAANTYPGATEVQVWKDNIYGSFMFFPEN